MRSAAAIVLAALACAAVRAQETGDVQGTVSDSASGEPLAGATVVLVGEGRGTTTGAGGEFFLPDVPPGPTRLRVSFVGYRAEVRRVAVEPGRTSVVTVRLLPSPVRVQPIEVSATRGRGRETPATISTLDRAALADRQPTLDIPVLLSDLPSVTSYSEVGTAWGTPT